MSSVQSDLNQSKRYLSGDRNVLMPYITNFSFKDEYPYTTKIIGVNQLRIDHLVDKITGTQYG